MSVITITNEEQFADVLESKDTLVVVKFSADWCRPCKQIQPVFEQLAAENPSARFLHINIDETNIKESETVTGLPTFRFYRDKTMLDEFTGANVSALRDKTENYLYFD